MTLSRRHLLQVSAAAAGTALATSSRAALGADVPAAGPFAPNWDSLIAGYRAPDWFRDAKFGIWAHWSAQCVPEFGDWYARSMYLQGDPVYQHHLQHYGHPADVGFMEMNHRWTGANWDPARLIDLYRKAGARYFVALANHHDNFDTYDSAHHGWNSLRVGPKKDIIGGWAKVAREQGLRFGVSNHSAHAWHWLQPAYGYDLEGPRKGQRYDAARLTKAAGAGLWWEGLDPQQLYTGPNLVLPDGVGSIGEANVWHEQNDRQWDERPPPANPAFVRQWAARCRDLIDKYRPDLLYFDNYGLPLGAAGLEVAAHYYNASLVWHGGSMQAVLNAKMLPPHQRFGLVEDVERGGRGSIDSVPWQTDTCIGHWHYDRALYETRGYKSVQTVVHSLCDIVAKNGNLLLSVPLRADGTHDSLEEAFLADLGAWIEPNGEAIYGTRPWRVFGEGPTNNGGGAFDEESAAPYTGRDIRFTTRDDALYAVVLGWPDRGEVKIESLATDAPLGRGGIQRVEILGLSGPLDFRRDSNGLHVTLPVASRDWPARTLKVRGEGIVT